MSPNRDQEALIDIIESIRLILRHADGVSYAQLASNTEKKDAILRRIMVIGEATKRLSPEFKGEHPTIPWKEIAGMRDVITHGYDEVDLDEVWAVVRENLPELLAYLDLLV